MKPVETSSPTPQPTDRPSTLPTLTPTSVDSGSPSVAKASYLYAKEIFGVLGLLFILVALWMGCCSKPAHDNWYSANSTSMPRFPGMERKRSAYRDTKYMRAGDDVDSHFQYDATSRLTRPDDEGGIELL